MPFSDGVPSSPPGPGTSLEDALAYYKVQYETLESELAEFQESSKALEAELERDIDASEKRERQFKEKATGLSYEVEEWKAKYKQAKSEASTTQNALQREITILRDTNRTLQLRLRDIEVANDDIERHQRNTESSLEDLESRYNQTIEREVMLEEEMRAGEQEREALRIEAQRLRDELSDLKIEADITKEKLRDAEGAVRKTRKALALDPVGLSGSPRSEVSPTTTDASSPTYDTPPPKTASSSGFSDAPTPPSPPTSEKSIHAAKASLISSIPKPRISINSNNPTPRPSSHTPRPSHIPGPSMVATSGRSTSSMSFRHSMSKSSNIPYRQPGLPQSNSIFHLRDLRGKMQKLEQRVQTAKSRLPAPISTPPKASPRSGVTLGHIIPSSVTVRGSRKRGPGSTISGTNSYAEQQEEETPSMLKPRGSRTSIGLSQPKATPTRGEMAAPPARPLSRASVSSRPSINTYVPGHSRPGSRASVSGFRQPLGGGMSQIFAPNASTDKVRPKSSLSSYGYDRVRDEVGPENQASQDCATPTPRRATSGRRTSDHESGIPSLTKRQSLSKLSAPVRRQSSSQFGKADNAANTMPPPRQEGGQGLIKVTENHGNYETF